MNLAVSHTSICTNARWKKDEPSTLPLLVTNYGYPRKIKTTNKLDEMLKCQNDTEERLMSPLSSFQREQDYAGYTNIANNVPLFHAINCMPIPLNPARLDEGSCIE